MTEVVRGTLRVSRTTDSLRKELQLKVMRFQIAHWIAGQ